MHRGLTCGSGQFQQMHIFIWHDKERAWKTSCKNTILKPPWIKEKNLKIQRALIPAHAVCADLQVKLLSNGKASGHEWTRVDAN